MCGIMGYVGTDDAWNVVISGLRRLEYRGYDSTGIATVAGDRLLVARKVGHLSALRDANPEGLPGHVGIGHTRWATHGGVTVENCHPHCDSQLRVAVVHNGIIDNVEALRAELVADGVVFRSETDTEVLAELVGSRAPVWARAQGCGGRRDPAGRRHRGPRGVGSSGPRAAGRGAAGQPGRGWASVKARPG